jgi:hypothetical protein
MSEKPFKRVIEQSYAWEAKEIVSQFKYGGFEGLKVEGVDGGKHRFKVEVKPEDINDEWSFSCNLIMDNVIDKMSRAGTAIELYKTGLESKQRIRDEDLGIEDPDAEQEIIDREETNADPIIKLRRQIAAFIEDGDKETAAFLIQRLNQLEFQMQPQEAGGTGGQPGVPQPVRPTAYTGNMQQNPNMNVARRMSRPGL